MSEGESASESILLTINTDTGPFTIPLARSLVKYSSSLTNTLESIPDCTDPIPIPNLSSPTLLQNIIAFLQDFDRHMTSLSAPEAKQLAENRYIPLADTPPEWLKRYLDIDPPLLLEQFLAADTIGLGIESLFRITARQITKLAIMKDTVEEIQKLFNISPIGKSTTS